MLSSSDIRGISFSKSMHGYKQDEVDVLLDKVEADYEQNERTIRAMQDEIERLKNEIEGYKSSQNSIQNVLLNAQRLADQIVAEAKEKSAEIIGEAQKNVDVFAAKEKELSAAFEEKASQRKTAVEKEIESTLRAAKLKNDSIEAATNDSVARQQLLFDKLKLEISAFKADVTKRYKEHLEILQKLPDEVPMDPKRIAEAVSAAVDRVPNEEEFIARPKAATNAVSAGFTVTDIINAADVETAVEEEEE